MYISDWSVYHPTTVSLAVPSHAPSVLLSLFLHEWVRSSLKRQFEMRCSGPRQLLLRGIFDLNVTTIKWANYSSLLHFYILAITFSCHGSKMCYNCNYVSYRSILLESFWDLRAAQSRDFRKRQVPRFQFWVKVPWGTRIRCVLFFVYFLFIFVFFR